MTSPRSRRLRLTLLGRPECGLCEELVEALHARFGPDAIELEQFDVDSREDWRRRFGLKIPVLLADDGSVVCSERLDDEAVAALL